MTSTNHSCLVNELALKLLQSSSKDCTISISTIGILDCLNIILQATNSDKLVNQIEKLLHFNVDEKNKKLDEKIKIINNLIHDIVNGDKEFFTMDLKTGICFPESSKIEGLSGFHHISIFQKNTELKAIHEEILKLTEGKLTDFLTHHNSSRTGVTLFNCIYPKVPFCEIFQPGSTQIGPFHVNSTKTIQIPMLRTGGMVMYNDDNVIGVRVMYHSFMGGNFNLIVLVPIIKFGISEVEKKLTTEIYKTLLDNMRPVLGSLTIPKLCINQTTDLKETLKHCELTDLFDPSVSNFTKLAKSNMAVDHFIQGVSINFNEFGCNVPKRELFERELYGHCVGGFTTMPEQQDIVANEPFLLIINYGKDDYIMHISRIIEPVINEN